jgi:hypothetical protein
MKRIWVPQVLMSVMLLWALYPDNPYGYYILLRWVCCASFAFLAVYACAIEKQGWAWPLGISALVYQPLIPWHLTREIWSVINVVTIAVAMASIFVLKSRGEES